jgi:transposase
VSSDEFKLEAVQLAKTSGQTVAQVARAPDVTDSALRNWIERSQQHSAGSELSTAERQELVQLRKENGVLRMERALLKKAAAFFAKEQT